MTSNYDAIIIGTGQAGPSLAARLAGAGMQVAIIERKRFGQDLRRQRPHVPPTLAIGHELRHGIPRRLNQLPIGPHHIHLHSLP